MNGFRYGPLGLQVMIYMITLATSLVGRQQLSGHLSTLCGSVYITITTMPELCILVMNVINFVCLVIPY